ncbi:MAG: hypothetical protein FJ077_04420 [Cyanobacteria bacterium K_DeepCast_35m_m2_023]|nr:hypothetical protein [Cyanobacteria bacterium K_DeepCast_35m_m2_023]
MVNASLNWASIVGIVLAVGGALLYFMRSFKPALARDYDVFFAAVGLLCGGILFFQGWRLDPILQFGQFLLAGTTVFFAYESVRLRGVTTEQARRSSYFDDEEPAGPYRPQMGGRPWDSAVDRFDEPQPIRRRIRSQPEDDEADEFYRPRRPSRAAIPERAASRQERSSVSSAEWDADSPSERGPSRYSASGSSGAVNDRSSYFGARRRARDDRSETRRSSRPSPEEGSMPRSSRRGPATGSDALTPTGSGSSRMASRAPMGEPLRSNARPPTSSDISDADFKPVAQSPRSASKGSAADNSTTDRSPRPRDNSSRFDD